MIKVPLKRFWLESQPFPQRQQRLCQIMFLSTKVTFFLKGGRDGDTQLQLLLAQWRPVQRQVVQGQLLFFFIELWSSHCLVLSLTEWQDEHLINVMLEGERCRDKRNCWRWLASWQFGNTLLEGWSQALQSILTVWEKKPGNNQPPLDDSWQLGHSWRQFGIVWMWLV